MKVKLLDLNGKPFFVEVPEEEMSQKVLNCIEQENRRTDIMLRQYRRKVDGFSDWDSISFNAMHIPESIRSLVESPEDLYIRWEMISDIMEVLKQCTEKQRNRFLLHVVSGLSHQKLADIFNCDKSSVRQSLESAKKKILMQLKFS